MKGVVGCWRIWNTSVPKKRMFSRIQATSGPVTTGTVNSRIGKQNTLRNEAPDGTQCSLCRIECTWCCWLTRLKEAPTFLFRVIWPARCNGSYCNTACRHGRMANLDILLQPADLAQTLFHLVRHVHSLGATADLAMFQKNNARLFPTQIINTNNETLAKL